jgi:hypothetical protein
MKGHLDELLRKSMWLKDRAATDHLIFHLLLLAHATPREVEAAMWAALDAAPGDVQDYWTGECDCGCEGAPGLH